MSDAAFSLIYDGEAVRDGEMNVADLAPALVAVAQLLKSAGKVLLGEDGDVNVRVRTMRDGSFEVMLAAAVNAGKSAWLWWKQPDVQAAASLLQVVGISGVTATGGAIGVVRALRGKAPTKVEAARPGYVRLELDGETLEVPDAEVRVALDPAVRAALERIVADPLAKEGIDLVAFGRGADAPVIPKEEADSFRAPLGPEDEFVAKQVKAFSIIDLSFKPGSKWRLSDGHGAARKVTLSDQEFTDRVQRNEVRFAKGDLLICEVVERSRRTPAGFKSDYEIVKVLEHRPAPPSPPPLPM